MAHDQTRIRGRLRAGGPRRADGPLDEGPGGCRSRRRSGAAPGVARLERRALRPLRLPAHSTLDPRLSAGRGGAAGAAGVRAGASARGAGGPEREDDATAVPRRRRRGRGQRRRGRRRSAPLAAASRDDPALSLPVDRVVRTTCSPNCTGSCGQLAFVRDGNVVKVQQAADYPENEYNPRGCMKGISYHLLIHGPDRILKPLVRTGERGSGEFREASWDEVLERIAGELKRIGEEWGWDSVHVFSQVPGSGYIQKGAAYRACAALGHDTRHELRLQRRPPHGHAHHLRRAERRARVQGLGEQPLHPADRRQPAGDAHPRRALHPRRRRDAARAWSSSTRRSRPRPRRRTPGCRSSPAPTRRSASPSVARSWKTARPTGTSCARSRTRRCSCAPTRASVCAPPSWPAGRPGTRARPPASASASTDAERAAGRHGAGGHDSGPGWRTACRRCPTTATSCGTRRAARP